MTPVSVPQLERAAYAAAVALEGECKDLLASFPRPTRENAAFFFYRRDQPRRASSIRRPVRRLSSLTDAMNAMLNMIIRNLNLPDSDLRMIKPGKLRGAHWELFHALFQEQTGGLIYYVKASLPASRYSAVYALWASLFPYLALRFCPLEKTDNPAGYIPFPTSTQYVRSSYRVFGYDRKPRVRRVSSVTLPWPVIAAASPSAAPVATVAGPAPATAPRTSASFEEEQNLGSAETEVSDTEESSVSQEF